MNAIECLKMLKSKIDNASENKYNYAIETSDVEAINQALNIPCASERTLDINSCGLLIKSMPLDQAIHIMKSDITGLPETQVIEGELVVAYVR